MQRRRRQAAFVLIPCLALLLLFKLSHGASWQLGSNSEVESARQQAHLHVLIPASKQDVNLCKLLLSLGILGYPSPVIINWNTTFDDPSLVEGGSHLAKITGVKGYIDSLENSHDDDLILMVDGYDIFFQLRPQTLVERYFDINRRANDRIESEIGRKAAKKHGIKQDIIFGCQKRCWPWTVDDPPCYAVPNSTLPRDIFGIRTDTPSEEDEYPFVNNRPRFLVSGTAMGTVKSFRKLFGQAAKQLEKEANFGSDQYIFSHVFGDQSVWREAKRRDEVSRFQHAESLHDHFNPEHVIEVRHKATQTPDGTFEFGIGIDYGSEIVINTVFAEDDTAWLDAAAEAEHTALRLQNGEPMSYRATELRPDITSTPPPFWTFSQEELPRWRSWQNVTLLKHVYTGTAPVLIHNNAHRDGLKSRRESWWPLLWFHHYARTLFDAHIYAPILPVAVAGYPGNTIREYWPYEIWKGGARDGTAKVGVPGDGWIRFDEVCSEYHEEIFRDGKGPWLLPAAH